MMTGHNHLVKVPYCISSHHPLPPSVLIFFLGEEMAAIGHGLLIFWERMARKAHQRDPFVNQSVASLICWMDTVLHSEVGHGGESKVNGVASWSGVCHDFIDH